MLDRNGLLFKLIFSVILFNPIAGQANDELERYQLHYTSLIEKYLVHSKNSIEDDESAAKKMGVISEIITLIST